MNLDVVTLGFVGALATCASGVMILGYWVRERDAAGAALWWGIANLLQALGIALLTFDAQLPTLASRALAPTLLIISPLATLAAARIFNRGSQRFGPFLRATAIGAVLFVAAVTLLREREAPLGTAVAAALYFATAAEFWRGRRDASSACYVLLALLAVQGTAVLLVAVHQFDQQALGSSGLVPLTWLGIIHFVAVIYAIGSAVFLIALLKEQSEQRLRRAASSDALTGLANRRAFLEIAERLVARSGQEGAPVALLAIDLDRFKRINDTFGHQTGDQVLKLFAETVTRALRPGDVVGRIGGEEFMAVLPHCGAEVAVAVAERVRAAFQDAAKSIGAQRVGATLSIGIAAAELGRCALTDLMGDADRALYRAKAGGRNRAALSDGGGSAASNVVRIA